MVAASLPAAMARANGAARLAVAPAVSCRKDLRCNLNAMMCSSNARATAPNAVSAQIRYGLYTLIFMGGMRQGRRLRRQRRRNPGDEFGGIEEESTSTRRFIAWQAEK